MEMAIAIVPSFAFRHPVVPEVTIMTLDIGQDFPETDKQLLSSQPGEFYAPPLAIASLCIRRFDTGYALSLRNSANLRWLKFESCQTVRSVQASLPPSVEHLIFSFCAYWQIPVLHPTSDSHCVLVIRQKDEKGLVRESTRHMPLRLQVLSALRSDGALMSARIPYKDDGLELHWT